MLSCACRRLGKPKNTTSLSAWSPTDGSPIHLQSSDLREHLFLGVRKLSKTTPRSIELMPHRFDLDLQALRMVVPVGLALLHRRPHRPDVTPNCDVSCGPPGRLTTARLNRCPYTGHASNAWDRRDDAFERGRRRKGIIAHRTILPIWLDITRIEASAVFSLIMSKRQSSWPSLFAHHMAVWPSRLAKGIAARSSMRRRTAPTRPHLVASIRGVFPDRVS